MRVNPAMKITELVNIDREHAVLELDGDREAYANICKSFQKQLENALKILAMIDPKDLQPALRAIHELITSAHIVGARKSSAYLRHCETALISGELTCRADIEATITSVRTLLAELKRAASDA